MSKTEKTSIEFSDLNVTLSLDTDNFPEELKTPLSQTYDPESSYAMSGVAIGEALKPVYDKISLVSGSVDQTYSPRSTYAQSGIAVKQAIDDVETRIKEFDDALAGCNAAVTMAKEAATKAAASAASAASFEPASVAIAAKKAQYAAEAAANASTQWYEEHTAALDYIIKNYGPNPVSPLPAPSDHPYEEGDWEYLKDEDLSSYVNEDKALNSEGFYKVYGVLLPCYKQHDNSTWSDTTCNPGLLPSWCDGDPKIFDSKGRKWSPSTIDVSGEDDFQGEYLFTWWNCNYIRCDNANRRIVAVEGMEHYAETGDADVGVMFAKFYWYMGNVDLETATGAKKTFTIVVKSPAPMDDPKFPADVKEKLTSMGITQLYLWKECVRWTEDYEYAAPYGVHSKYFSVLGGSSPTYCKPRSQKGHLLTNVSHNGFVVGGNVTDGATGYKGVTNYNSKGIGFRGSGMDRNLFILIHILLKSADKNTQKYMSGQVNSLVGQTQCRLGSTEAEATFTLAAPGKSVLVNRGAETAYTLNMFVSVGGTGRDVGNAHQCRGQVKGYAYHTHPTTGQEYAEIILDLQYGKEAFTYTTGHYIMEQLPPSGTTDLVPGHRDGSAYILTGAHSTPCRMMGTEYGVGAFQIFLDVTREYKPGNVLKLWYANPRLPRQTDSSYIANTYTDLGTEGISGSYYVCDIEVDHITATYKTVSIAGNNSSTTGYCDRVDKDGSTSGFRAYWAFGSVDNMAGSSSGLVASGCVGYWGGNVSLAGAVWCGASCD